MFSIPLIYASLVAFPAAEPCGIALLPADQTDVAAALVKKDLHQLLAVFGFIFMNCACIIVGSLSQFIDVRIGIFADDAEELCQIYAVVIGGIDCGHHLCIRGVADDDTLAAGCDQLIDGSRNLLGYVALVNVLDLNAESLGCLVEDLLALGTENVCGAPDGYADLDVAVIGCFVCKCSHRASCEQGANHSCTKCCTDEFAFHNTLLKE